LFDNVEKGKKWAIRTFLEQKKRNFKQISDIYPNDFSAKGMVAAEMHDLAGFELGKNTEKWREWFKRVTQAFPKLTETSTKMLLEKVNHEDPWVHVFALKELFRRWYNYTFEATDKLLTIFEEACADEDSVVKEYAKRRIDKLRGDDE